MGIFRSPTDRRGGRRRLAAFLLLLGLLLPWAGVRAEPAGQTGGAAAKAQYQKGRDAYQRGDYAAAVAGFLAAHDIDPAPILLFNVAQSYWKMGEPEPARRYYRAYLADDPNAPNRAQVEARIRTLEPAGYVASRAAAGSSPTMRPAGTPGHLAGLAAPAPVLVAGNDLGIDAGTARAPAEPPRPLYRRPWFWGAVGGLLIGVVTVGILAASDRGPWSCSACELSTQRVPGP
jgi:tetratricopeptide (TPR) repeat protein